MVDFNAEKSYKIAVVGDKESVIGFRAVGFSVFIAGDVSEAERIVHALSKADSEFAIIFLIEDYAVKLSHIFSRYVSAPIPAVISIPGRNGSSGFGMEQVKKAVERAVGADILFKNET